MAVQLKPQTWKVINTDISEMNFVGCAKVQTKSWNDAQTSENVQNLEFLPKNAFIEDKYVE